MDSLQIEIIRLTIAIIIRAITFSSDPTHQRVGFNTWKDLKIGLHQLVWRSIWIYFSKWGIVCYTDFVK